MKSILLIVYLHLLVGCYSQCHNSCNKHGKCNLSGICECYNGWTGYDCTSRVCPSGPVIADIAHAKDVAHQIKVCSGRGSCNTDTGLCSCFSGFTGNNCGRLDCGNKCSNHGECISLKAMATRNDGYIANRTTTYDNWDSDIFYGCVCDFGYSGYDCSQKSCPSGIDPRMYDDSLAYDKVTFACDCLAGSCNGRFKLRYAGIPLNTWFTPKTTLTEFENALQTIPAVNTPTYYSIYVLPANITLIGTSNNLLSICKTGEIVKTNIFIKRNSVELPSLKVYASLITGGSIYFEVIGYLYLILTIYELSHLCTCFTDEIYIEMQLC